MSLGIGIDTGGTYTDAVIYDFDTKQVMAKGKSLTTKENLTLGIGNAMDCLPIDLLNKAKIIALSTTLATNACVENKHGRAKLVLVGTSRKVLDWIDAKTTYGLKNEDVMCIDTRGSFDGTFIDEPNWDKLIADEKEWFSDAHALSIAEVNALRNGAVCERNAKAKLTKHFDVPIVIASELVSGLNVMERGATALLNARLLPVIEEFMKAVSTAMKERGLDIPAMVVRSDGSLMLEKLSYIRPVETILSGPASSVIGGRGLTNCENCLIVDMGGTTTDISIVKDNIPAMTQGIRIGGWRTQIKGVYIDTFGLGGDSRIFIKDNKLTLSCRRVQPMCIMAAKFPEIKLSLKKLLEHKNSFTDPLHEFLYLVNMPNDLSQYNSYETELIEILKNGPVMLGSGEINLYRLKSERLEDEGIVMRCGLTPTDIMHIKGDFCLHDSEASVLAARYFLDVLPQYEDDEDGLTAFCDTIYEMVCKKLYENIVRVLITNKYPKLASEAEGDSLSFIISQSYMNDSKKDEDSFFKTAFTTSATLIGIGAPTHIFLPTVAKALKTGCIIPKHAEVANAVGAITADITANATIEISPNYTSNGVMGYAVFTKDENLILDTLEEAVEAAEKSAVDKASEEARRHGAIGELSIEVKKNSDVGYAKGGGAIDLGTKITAVASGRIALI